MEESGWGKIKRKFARLIQKLKKREASWWWHNDAADQDKRSGKPSSKRRVDYVSIKLRWFKDCKNLSYSLYADGGETEVGYYITIPYLFHFSITASLTGTAFRRWFPKTYELGGTLSISLYASREFFNVEFLRLDTGDSDTDRGFSFSRSWSEILKGRQGRSEIGEPVAMGVWHKTIIGKTTPNSKEPAAPVDVTITVHKVHYVTHFPRWFPKHWHRWEVSSDKPLYRAGKGENSWDQDDTGYGEVSYGVNIKSAEAAVEEFVGGYYRDVAKYGQ